MLQNSLSVSISVKTRLFCKLHRQLRNSWKIKGHFLKIFEFLECSLRLEWLWGFWCKPPRFLPVPTRLFVDFGLFHSAYGSFEQYLSNLLLDCTKLENQDWKIDWLSRQKEILFYFCYLLQPHLLLRRLPNGAIWVYPIVSRCPGEWQGDPFWYPEKERTISNPFIYGLFQEKMVKKLRKNSI